MSYKADDIRLLLPAMQVKVQALLDAVVKAGFTPVLFDTWRAPGQAKKNAAKGTGITDSMHCYGAAADVICAVHGWDCHKSGCSFYETFVSEARKLGFVCGVDFPNVDTDHVQGIKVRDQNAMRALGREPSSVAARDALIRKFFGCP
jgi:hypothetical protein